MVCPKILTAQELLLNTQEFVLRQALTREQKKLFKTALKGLGTQVHDMKIPPPFFAMPLFVYGAIKGNHEPAIPLVIASSLVYLGADIHDDLADGDVPSHWKGASGSERNLAATTLLCSLPQMAIAKLEAEPEVIAAMHKSLAQGLLRMAAGQELDLAHKNQSKISPDDLEQSLSKKSGEELVIFARLAAQLAGAPPKILDSYCAMARAMGTAGQLSSDCHDIFQARWSRDLANGTRTMPIALYVEKLNRQREKSDRFLLLLEEAKKNKSAQLKVRKLLLQAGVLRHCAFHVEIYCQRALSLLKEAKPIEPYGNALVSFINSLSYFPKKEVTNELRNNGQAHGQVEQ